jgi:hypothetical protein
LPFVFVYPDDLTIISNGTYEDHLDKTSIVLGRLKEAGLAVNALKRLWATDKHVGYFGFVVSDYKLRKSKPFTISRLHRTSKELRRLVIGFVNHYQYMWKHQSHLLAPLTDLMSTKRKFAWTSFHQAAFVELKRVTTDEVLLSYPDYTKLFHLFTDSSYFQVGGVLTQEDTPIVFYSKKLNAAQCHYPIGDKETLAILATLWEL